MDIYENYCRYMEAAGKKPLSFDQITDELLILVQTHPAFFGVRIGWDAKGIFFTGLDPSQPEKRDYLFREVSGK